jgi:serine/threonine protein kinase
MKLVSGRTLAEILKGWHSRDPYVRWEFPLTRLLSIFERVCETVGFAHARKVVHCDLKPENIMIGEYGEVWLLDWGVSRIMDRQITEQRRQMLGDRPEPVKSTVTGTLTPDGAVGGTPSYMAPEHAKGTTIDDGADIFALGAVLYQILTGKPPYEGRSAPEVMLKAAEGRFVSVKKTPTGKHAPAQLAAITERCMAAGRDKRYLTVSDLIADLRAYAAGEPVRAYRVSIFPRIGRYVWRQTRAAVIGSGLLCLALVGVTAAAVVVTQKYPGRFHYVEQTLEEIDSQVNRYRRSGRNK